MVDSVRRFLRSVMKRTKTNVGAGAVMGLLLVFSGSLFAQTGNGSIGGSVQDPSKGQIPGVTVTARNVGTNISTMQLTNESGVYNFPVLQPGTYEVWAELPGFKKSVERTELPYAGQVRVNFTLEVGQVSQVV